MFQTLFKNIALGAARHLLTGLGASLITDGYITSSDNDQAVGAILFLLGLAWSGWQKYNAHKKIVAAAASPGDDMTGATAKLTAVDVRPLDPIQ